MMSDAHTGQLQRSYERNLGYAKFWIGVFAAFVLAFAAFAAEKFWEISTNPAANTPQDWNPLLIIAWVLAAAALICLGLAVTFVTEYHRADLALTAIEQSSDDAG